MREDAQREARALGEPRRRGDFRAPGLHGASVDAVEGDVEIAVRAHPDDGAGRAARHIMAAAHDICGGQHGAAEEGGRKFRQQV